MSTATTATKSMDTNIEEMINLATQEYEKTRDMMELSYEKKILQLQTIHETTKYDNVTNYFKILFDEKTVLATTEGREKLQQFPIFPDGFITTLQFDEEKHTQLLESLETSFLEDMHKLQLKYTASIQQLNECKKNQPLVSSTWFSIFENDSETSQDGSDESDESEVELEYETTHLHKK